VSAEDIAYSQKPTDKQARVRKLVHDFFHEKTALGEKTTNLRFIFYELEQRGDATKPTRPGKQRYETGWPPGEQNITKAATWLRDEGHVPWSWIRDETRTLHRWSYGSSVLELAKRQLEDATVNPWGHKYPPVILCESKAAAGVLQDVASRYCCPIAGTGGQTAGFLHTVIKPYLDDELVLYLGDFDRCGMDIEANTRKVLGVPGDRWRRLAMTEEQTVGRTPIFKVDKRTGESHEAWEVESMGQAPLVKLLKDALDALLPEPLEDVLARTELEKVEVRERLEGPA